MKTKLSFYCTHLQYGSFQKVIFETILDQSFEDILDAKEWLDMEIPFLYNNFGFDLVFDWVIIDYKQTDEDVKPVEIIDTIKGKLTFREKEKKVKEKIYKIDVPKAETKIEPTKKTYASVWIDPFGKTYNVGFAMHNEFAGEWLEENDKDLYIKTTKSYNTYYYEVLQNKGWARILGWTEVPTFVLPDKINPKLKNALREYCLANDVAYKDFPEILKS